MATSTSTAVQRTHPVHHVPTPGKLAALGLQHVLAFYAGAVIVPLLIASSLNLDAETTIHLINADLLTCGIATLIQVVGIGKGAKTRAQLEARFYESFPEAKPTRTGAIADLFDDA